MKEQADSPLAAVAKVVVGLIQPIGPWRIEDVEIDGFFERPRFVRHVGRDAQNFAGANDDFLSVDRKFQRAFQNISHLLVVMLVQRHMRAFFHQHAREHHLVADDLFAIDQRIQLFALDIFPRNIFKRSRRAHFDPPYSFAALSCRYICASSIAFTSVKAPSETSSASAAASAVRVLRAESQKLSSAPSASLNGNASDAYIILSGKSVMSCLITSLNCDG